MARLRAGVYPIGGSWRPGRWDLPAAGRRAHAPHFLALIGLSVVSLAYHLVFPEAHLMLKLNLVHLFENAGKVIAFAILLLAIRRPQR
jgi:hypothetical protein